MTTATATHTGGSFYFGPIRGILLALALALAMRRERTWPTSPNCGEAPAAAGPPLPKTAAWPWSPSRSRWSGWRSWTSGSMRFGRATSPGRTASLRARFPSFLPPFQAGVPALPSNTPKGVDTTSLEQLMASSDRVGAASSHSRRLLLSSGLAPTGRFRSRSLAKEVARAWAEGGRHSAASSRVRQSSTSRLRLPGRPPTCPMTQGLGLSGWRLILGQSVPAPDTASAGMAGAL